MEFHEKLQQLRKQKGMTQEELAQRLYVSRTAISKWESGRGYPNIESLREIAKFFSITVDELLSSQEVLALAEEDGRKKEHHLRDLMSGLLDLCFALLLFLPLFAVSTNGTVNAVSLLSLGNIHLYLKIGYYALVIGMIAMGIFTLALQNCEMSVWIKSKAWITVALNVALVLLFIISRQVYAATFSFVLLLIKGLMLLKSP